MSGYTSDPRIRWTEWLPWVAAIAFFFAMPEYLSLGARILIYATTIAILLWRPMGLFGVRA